MNDFQKPIDNREVPKDWIITHGMEKDKKEKREFSKETDQNAFKALVFASLTAYLKKTFSFCSSRNLAKSSQLDEQQLIQNLIAFKKMLLILREKEMSPSPEFFQQLSALWHILNEDCNQAVSLEKKRTEELVKIKFFIERINTFPLNEEHSLGFYLTHYAGMEWLPFPFMEMLRQLHVEYQQNPQESHLHEWISRLNEIIASFEKVP